MESNVAFFQNHLKFDNVKFIRYPFNVFDVGVFIHAWKGDT